MGFPRFVFRTLLFALLWWILTQGAINSWLVQVGDALVAVLASGWLLPTISWSLPGIAGFVPFFLWRSLYGVGSKGDTAMSNRLPISPLLFDYRWRLPPGLPRGFMANTVSLLPGTLSAELGIEHLRVHVLDQSGDFISELSVVEERVARLFGLSLADGESEG